MKDTNDIGENDTSNKILDFVNNPEIFINTYRGSNFLYFIIGDNIRLTEEQIDLLKYLSIENLKSPFSITHFPIFKIFIDNEIIYIIIFEKQGRFIAIEKRRELLYFSNNPDELFLLLFISENYKSLVALLGKFYNVDLKVNFYDSEL